MEIDGLTKQQVKIADMLWMSDTLEEAEKIVKVFGKEASVVMELMLLASLDDDVDQMQEYSDAERLLLTIMTQK